MYNKNINKKLEFKIEKTFFRINPKLMKKSQIKMMETISVMLVFLILLTFVVIFYANISQSGASSKVQDRSNLQSIAITQVMSSLPEFQCAFKNIIIENCFDILKVKAFTDFTKTPFGNQTLGTIYFDMFKFSKLNIHEVYPYQNEWIVYDLKPNRTRYDERKTYVPISLYNASANKYYFGMLEVTVYS
jgi:hypothetical protein